MCSRHVNDVAVSVTPSSVTIEPSTMVGRRSRAHSGNDDDGTRGRRAVAQRVLDVPGGQPGQDPGHQQHGGAGEEVGSGLAGVGQPEDQQGPVPQVQRVGHRTERHERRAGQQPVRGGHAVVGGASQVGIGSAVGGAEDEQHRRADGHQRPRAGELLDPVDERAARQDRGQRHRRDSRAQPHRPPHVGHHGADQRAEQQFPAAREAVVVGGRLVRVVREDRVHERRDGEHAQAAR